MSLENVAKLLDRRATFTINKNQVYRGGKPVANRFKFIETVSLALKDKAILETVVEIFPSKIMKLKSGLFKIVYSGSSAASLVSRIYPYLVSKVICADIILELHDHKHIARTHAPETKMLERNAIREKILRYNAL